MSFVCGVCMYAPTVEIATFDRILGQTSDKEVNILRLLVHPGQPFPVLAADARGW